jgi:hypothetical protein
MNVHVKRIPMYLALAALALSSATATVYAVTAIATPAAFSDAMINAAQELFRENIAQANNVAYRDGLYEGKLAATRGAGPTPSVGRWSATEDRASFAAGYRQALTEKLAANQ